jgi:hypothetical protein
MTSVPEDIREPVYSHVLEYAQKQVAIPTRRKTFRRADWQKQSSAGKATKKKK